MKWIDERWDMVGRRSKRGRSTSKISEPIFERFGIAPEQYEKFRTDALEAARDHVDSFPQKLEAILNMMRINHPLQILSVFTLYGLSNFVDAGGVEPQATPLDVLQSHAELLQALVLTIPIDKWGTNPVAPDVMQAMFDGLPELSRTLLSKRILASVQITDDQERVISSLQDRVRSHTHIVRNWGYYGHVTQISTELYAPLDEPLRAHFGFSATELINVARAVVTEYGRRMNEHFNVLQKIARGKNAKQIARLYYKHVPDLKGTPEELLATVPAGVTREGMMGFLMAHFDLRAMERSTFAPQDVEAATGLSTEVIRLIFKAMALAPGALAQEKIEHLFLTNPVWAAPFINMEKGFFIPMPQAIFSHIHRLMERLTSEAGLKRQLKDRRAAYLEAKLHAIISNAMPGATISAGVKWNHGVQHFETDILVILDRVVLIAEAKSHRLTPEGLRGAPGRVRRHITEMVLDPSVQSARLKELIESAKGGDRDAIAIVTDIGIEPGIVDRVIRISVTLDDFSVLSSSEGEFKKIGWVPSSHLLAPTIQLADLMCIADILNNPISLIHYLAERDHIQKAFELLGDEMDLLGVYLDTGFHLSGLQQNASRLVLAGMSSELDRYYESLDAGIAVPKPKPRLSEYFQAIIDRLSERRMPGWTMAGFHLLSCANFAEQKKIGNKLLKLRSIVRKNFRDPEHTSSVVVQPPDSRKALVVFYLFPEKHRTSSRKSMEDMAAQVLDQKKGRTCVVFGRSTEQWTRPYEAVLIVSPKVV